MKHILARRRAWYALMVLLLGSTCVQAENWMSRLPDDMYVAVVSIPGTHDAATGCGWQKGRKKIGNRFAKTQDIDLKTQWSIGIRAFDLRPCLYKEYMNINHSIVPTKVRLEDVLCMLRDSLAANPSEFVVIHMQHEDDGDQVKDDYNARLLDLLGSDEIKSCLVDFRTDLRVGDVRGKILLLSRDRYSDNPVGGIFRNWTFQADWARQTAGRIIGPHGATGIAYVQDYYDTHAEGAIDTKIAALRRMLDFSTTHQTETEDSIRWIFNFASGFSRMTKLFGHNFATSEGYRENAAHTNATVLEYLSTHPAGPTGIVMMDYAGVDSSKGYEVKGLQLVKAIIGRNFK